ncbi:MULTISPECIES: hypothetical protein [unclassified Microcoleus]|uniref:hypothetical protein n=1 Tax=unclassified Microcoleus TaxID=2642155 RepID=UPI002FD28B5C
MLLLDCVQKVELDDDKPFNSLTPDQLAGLNRAFWSDQEIKFARKSAVSAGAVGVGVGILGAGGSFAQVASGGAGDAAAAAKASIESGVTNAIDMIKAIDGIGLAAFGVALAPLGFMTTLRVLNMVLSRV